jgi:hypothetical protein
MSDTVEPAEVVEAVAEAIYQKWMNRSPDTRDDFVIFATAAITAYKATRDVSASPQVAQSDEHSVMVPVEPTEEMLRAAKGALKAYIDALPYEERSKHSPRHPGDYPGYRVSPVLKYRLRWAAMLAARPVSQNVKAGDPRGKADTTIPKE